MEIERGPTLRTFTQEDPIGLAGGLNLYGFGGGDPLNFSDPFGLCDHKKDPDCELVSQATAGATVGSKGGGKLLDRVGLQWRLGVTIEAGVRQTVNLEQQQVEHDAVGVVQAGLEIKATFLGMHFKLRIGFDSEDPDDRLIELSTIPDDKGTFEFQGQLPPVGLGASGTYKVNPFGAYLSTLPSIKRP